MRLDRTAAVARAALAGAVAWACACRQSPAEPSTASVDAASIHAAGAAPVVRAAADAGPLRRTGLVGMIFHAAHDLTLTPDQASALASIDGSLGVSDEGVRSALRSLEAHVVAGIRAGKLDPKTTAPDYAALDGATKDRADRQAAALGTLRGLLTPPQREDLVLAVRARRAAHSLRPPDAPEDDGDWTQRRLDRLGETLDLDEAQKKKVAALLAKSALPRAQDVKARKDAEKTRGDALLRAFQADEFFDARAIDGGAIAERAGEDFIEGEDAFLGQLLGVLTPAQREKLAASREGRTPAAE
jgi:Spy/CpxP family protein refolding chaperone